MENFIKSIQENHSVHGLGLGVVIYLLTKKAGLALVLGGGAYAYMRRFEHRTDVTMDELQTIFDK